MRESRLIVAASGSGRGHLKMCDVESKERGGDQGSLWATIGLPDGPGDSLKTHQVIRRGIDARMIGLVASNVGLSSEAMAVLIGWNPPKGAARSDRQDLIPAFIAERLVRVLELYELADEVFASRSDVGKWLTSQHPLLDGESPLQRAQTSYGGESVKSLLMSTKHGGAC